MPLSCDCYGGCWGDHSKGWPSIAFTDAAWRRCVELLPYGSYVRMPGEKPSSERTWKEWTGQAIDQGTIRVERPEYVGRIADGVEVGTGRPVPPHGSADRYAMDAEID